MFMIVRERRWISRCSSNTKAHTRHNILAALAAVEVELKLKVFDVRKLKARRVGRDSVAKVCLLYCSNKYLNYPYV